MALTHDIITTALLEAEKQGIIARESDTVEAIAENQQSLPKQPIEKSTVSTTSPPQSVIKLISQSSDAMLAFADNAHVQCAKFLGYRTDQNAQLPTTEFYRLFGVTWGYILESEAVCGKMCFGLRGTLLSQVNPMLV
jgi:hypothetical protein